MATDAWVAFPQYHFEGYNKDGEIWGKQVGTVYVQVTHDGDKMPLLLQSVLRRLIIESQQPIPGGLTLHPEFVSARFVHALYEDDYRTVLVCVQKPQEGEEYSYTLDCKAKTVTIHNRVDRVFSYNQFLDKHFVYIA